MKMDTDTKMTSQMGGQTIPMSMKMRKMTGSTAFKVEGTGGHRPTGGI